MKNLIVAVMLFTFFLFGCGGTDYVYVDTNEQPPGPGLFSGEDGVFTVVKKGTESGEIEEKSGEEANKSP